MKERKKPAISFSGGDFSTLRGVLAQDRTLEGAVLLVMVATSIRVGDVLRLELAQLRAALRADEGVVVIVVKGGRKRVLPVDGAREAWERLAEACGRGSETVADAVCPTSTWGARGGGGAYQRVNRHLRDLCRAHGLSGRAHLHRVRRTVATNALKATKDIHLVSELLGHAHVATTEIYLDEVRSGEVAELQRKLAGKG